MATNPTDYIDAADTGDDLVAWAQPNTAVLNDEACDAAVRRALGGPTPDDLAFGVPLLRFADTTVDPVPLVAAVIYNTRHAPTVCDRCGDIERSVLDRLLVPCQASVVALHICWSCHLALEMPHRGGSTLVWD